MPGFTAEASLATNRARCNTTTARSMPDEAVLVLRCRVAHTWHGTAPLSRIGRRHSAAGSGCRRCDVGGGTGGISVRLRWGVDPPSRVTDRERPILHGRSVWKDALEQRRFAGLAGSIRVDHIDIAIRSSVSPRSRTTSIATAAALENCSRRRATLAVVTENIVRVASIEVPGILR